MNGRLCLACGDAAAECRTPGSASNWSGSVFTNGRTAPCSKRTMTRRRGDAAPSTEQSGSPARRESRCGAKPRATQYFPVPNPSLASPDRSRRHGRRRELISFANFFCVPHDLQTGQQLNVTWRSPRLHVPDALSLVGGAVLRPVLVQGVLGRACVREAGLLVPARRDGAAGGGVAAR